MIKLNCYNKLTSDPYKWKTKCKGKLTTTVIFGYDCVGQSYIKEYNYSGRKRRKFSNSGLTIKEKLQILVTVF